MMWLAAGAIGGRALSPLLVYESTSSLCSGNMSGIAHDFRSHPHRVSIVWANSGSNIDISATA